MIIKNKKGEEISRVGGIIIGILCLLLIIAAVVIIYKAVSNNENDAAKTTLDSVVGKMNALGVGQDNTFLVQGFKTNHIWIIASWSKSDSADLKPDQCFFKSCLCICPVSAGPNPAYDIRLSDNTYIDVESNSQERALNCQTNGFCRTFDEQNLQASMVDSIYSSYIKINTQKSEYNIIPLQQNSIGVEINKTQDSIEITRTF